MFLALLKHTQRSVSTRASLGCSDKPLEQSSPLPETRSGYFLGSLDNPTLANGYSWSPKEEGPPHCACSGRDRGSPFSLLPRAVTQGLIYYSLAIHYVRASDLLNRLPWDRPGSAKDSLTNVVLEGVAPLENLSTPSDYTPCTLNARKNGLPQTNPITFISRSFQKGKATGTPAVF
ncbi:hypothetical protein FRC12_001997 [Ceratobasidium sp. 428]|nr:hypothetical protein FRC12_001997 [Ceratobasidium sp. 428]